MSGLRMLSGLRLLSDLRLMNDLQALLRIRLFLELCGALAVFRAELVEQRMETGVVAGFQQMHELMGNDEFQTFGRIRCKPRGDADGSRFWGARSPACLHDPHRPSRGVNTHYCLKTLVNGRECALDFSFVQVIEPLVKLLGRQSL